MARVVDDALHADECAAGDAEVAHQFFRVGRTEIRFLHQFLLFVRKLERQVVLRQLLSLELLLQTCPANGAERESLLFQLDEAHFAERVSTPEITRDPHVAIEVLIA